MSLEYTKKKKKKNYSLALEIHSIRKHVYLVVE